MLDGGWRMQDVPGWLPGTEGLLWLCAMSNVAARTTAGSAVRPMGRQYPRGRKMAGGHLPGTISLIYWHGLKRPAKWSRCSTAVEALPFHFFSSNIRRATYVWPGFRIEDPRRGRLTVRPCVPALATDSD